MVEVGNGKKYIGTCERMCPIEEAKMREANGLLHKFELSNKPSTRGRGRGRGRGRQRADPDKLVKEFMRPAAGKAEPQPWELRTVNTIHTTVSYLLSRVAQETSGPWHLIYEFIFDRLRAVRQEVVIQRIEGEPAIQILERIIRFLIYSNYRLCTENISNFDSKINESHLQECLKWLLCLYEDCPYACHQGEFVSLYLLFNLGNTEAIRLALDRIKHLRHDETFERALQINLCWMKKNYVRLFCLIRHAPILHRCAIHRHIASVHRDTLCIMSSGYNNKALTYPLSELTSLLSTDSTEDTRTLCSLYGVPVKEKHVKFSKQLFKDPEKTVEPKHYQFIETDLKDTSLTTLLLGPDCLCSDS